MTLQLVVIDVVVAAAVVVKIDVVIVVVAAAAAVVVKIDVVHVVADVFDAMFLAKK